MRPHNQTNTTHLPGQVLIKILKKYKKLELFLQKRTFPRNVFLCMESNLLLP